MSFSGSTYGRYSRIWLIITGVILLAVGGGMAVALGGIPFAGGMMLLTGGILAAVGIALIVIGIIVGQRAAKTDQLLQTGVPGSAAITGLTQTGMYFNENPQVRMQLLVNVPGQAPYAASHTEVVPLILLGRLTSGAPLAVRVDPADPSRLAVDWGSSGFVAGMPAMGGMSAMGGMPGRMQAPDNRSGHGCRGSGPGARPRPRRWLRQPELPAWMRAWARSRPPCSRAA